MTDKNGRIFGKINIIDLLVIIVIIAAACITVFKFTATSGKGNTKVNTAFSYTLKVTDVRDFTAKQFAEGDNLYDDETGKFIGKVTAVKTEQSKEYALKSDGTYNYTERPGRFDVYVTVSTNGTVKDTGYFAEGIRQIAPHSTIVLSSQKLKTNATVENIEQ